MKLTVYTSCALNYYAKARVLADTLHEFCDDVRVVLCICDRLPEDLNPLEHGFDAVWTPEDLGYSKAWIFEHNIMELCTAVKGRALVRLMETYPDTDLFAYFDPDVCVYGDIALADGYLGDGSIGLIPHITAPEKSDIGVRMTEMSVTEHGIYNLGHLFVRSDENGRALAQWWADRLDRYCFDDRENGLFTDQRWMDLAPSIFDGVRILRVPNLDVASWNIANRTITPAAEGSASRWEIDGWPLLTYHFSGTGPTGTHRRVRDIFDAANPAMAEIERDYEEAIAAHGQALLEHEPPHWDTFDDGARVPATARGMYRRHPDLQSEFPDPYLAEGFADWLRTQQPWLMSGMRVPPAALNRAFDDLFDAEWYLDRYPEARDAVERGIYPDARTHYIHIGSALHYDPNVFFVTRDYLARAKYVEGQRVNGSQPDKTQTILWHYLTVGLPEGLEPIEFFDSKHYIAANPDVRQGLLRGAVSTPLAHFLRNGAQEGRAPGPDLDLREFMTDTPLARDLVNLAGAKGGFGAFVMMGKVAGRIADSIDAAALTARIETARQTQGESA